MKDAERINGTDLFAYLYNKYLDDIKEPATKKAAEKVEQKLEAVLEFVTFVRDWVAKSPPVSFDYRSLGNGVTFSNGDRVSFLPDVNDADNYQTYQGGDVPVTSQNRDFNFIPPDRHGFKI